MINTREMIKSLIATDMSLVGCMLGLSNLVAARPVLDRADSEFLNKYAMSYGDMMWAQHAALYNHLGLVSPTYEEIKELMEIYVYSTGDPNLELKIALEKLTDRVLSNPLVTEKDIDTSDIIIDGERLSWS